MGIIYQDELKVRVIPYYSLEYLYQRYKVQIKFGWRPWWRTMCKTSSLSEANNLKKYYLQNRLGEVEVANGNPGKA